MSPPQPTLPEGKLEYLHRIEKGEELVEGRERREEEKKLVWE